MHYVAGFFLIVAVAAAGTAGWFKIQLQDALLENQNLVVELEAEKANVAAARTALELQTEQVAAAEEKMAQLRVENERARAQVAYTRNLFADHDFQNLMEKKPGLITKRMQDATDRVFADLNSLTQ